MNYQNNRQKILMLRGLNIQCDMLSTTYYWIMLDFQCEGKICESCQEVIADRYFLHVNGGCWHADCLRCCVCYSSLEQEDSCFVKEDNIYCKQDYIRYLSLSLSLTDKQRNFYSWLHLSTQGFEILWDIQITVEMLYIIKFLILHFSVNLGASVLNAVAEFRRQTGSDEHVTMCITWLASLVMPVNVSYQREKSSRCLGVKCCVYVITKLWWRGTPIKVRVYYFHPFRKSRTPRSETYPNAIQ